MSSYREERPIEEENKLARRGGCIASVFLFICIICCGGTLVEYSPQGRNIIGWYFLEESTNGIIMNSSFESYANQSCDLAREVPRPPDYQERQNQLEGGYQTTLVMYRKYWNRMKRDGGDTSRFAPPDQIPQNLAAGKARYCR